VELFSQPTQEMSIREGRTYCDLGGTGVNTFSFFFLQERVEVPDGGGASGGTSSRSGESWSEDVVETGDRDVHDIVMS
jgi:hypothetical protein